MGNVENRLSFARNRADCPWSELSALCRTAEDVGFDSIWVPDHLIYRFENQEPTGPWEERRKLSAIAAVTIGSNSAHWSSAPIFATRP